MYKRPADGSKNEETKANAERAKALGLALSRFYLLFCSHSTIPNLLS